jgi:hypothetical protein
VPPVKNLFQNYHSMPWRDSISRRIAPVSSVAGGDDTTRPRRQDHLQGIYSRSGLPNIGATYQNGKIYQMATKCTKFSHNLPKGLTIYTNLLLSMALQNIPKSEFLVRKNTIWQPCSLHSSDLSSYFLLSTARPEMFLKSDQKCSKH